MRLTLGTDYALRTLIYVGALGRAARDDCRDRRKLRRFQDPPDEGRQQARPARLSRDDPRQGGGIRLARSPGEIRVGAVVRETEEDLAVVGCLAATGFCRIEGCCVLRRALREATLAFLRTLDGYTLADLLAAGAPLAHSLGLAAEMRPAE